MNWSNAFLIAQYGETFRSYRRILGAWMNKSASAVFHERQTVQTRQLLNRFLGLDGREVPFKRLEAEIYR